MKNSGHNHRTFHPSKEFDRQLERLATLVSNEGWSFSGLDTKQIKKDAQRQQADRANLDAVTRQYVASRERFAAAQAERHTRFAAVLRTARAVFRDDKAIMAQLDVLTPRSRRAKKPADPAVTGAPEAPATTPSK